MNPALRSALSAAVGACAAVAVFTVAQDTPERPERRLGSHVRSLNDEAIEDAWSSMSNVLWLADEGELQDPQRRHDAATVYMDGYEALEARCAEVLS